MRSQRQGDGDGPFAPRRPASRIDSGMKMQARGGRAAPLNLKRLRFSRVGALEKLGLACAANGSCILPSGLGSAAKYSSKCASLWVAQTLMSSACAYVSIAKHISNEPLLQVGQRRLHSCAGALRGIQGCRVWCWWCWWSRPARHTKNSCRVGRCAADTKTSPCRTPNSGGLDGARMRIFTITKMLIRPDT